MGFYTLNNLLSATDLAALETYASNTFRALHYWNMPFKSP
jgi:hypothetical protein|tara:strand:+ start:185 stop:304 length:120 start_codon:yes stop_codon:yes gene_type:complete